MSCGKKEDVNGTIKGAQNLDVVFSQVYFNEPPIPLGKVTADKDGSFALKLSEPLKEGIYQLQIGVKRIAFPLDGAEKSINIKADLATFDKLTCTIEGSKGATSFVDFMKKVIDNQKVDKPEIEKFLAEANPMVATMTLMQFGNQYKPEDYIAKAKEIQARLQTQFPNSKYTMQFATHIAGIEKQQLAQTNPTTVKIGDEAPEIELKDVNGKTRKLSDLKGKVVLLDFWASWCRPCRMENPNVVEAYKKYHDKGFDIYSVSLDGIGAQSRARMETPQALEKELNDKKQLWIAAIKQDGLIWENHVSDLMQWDCEPAQKYGVSSIPSQFLIGKDGKIISINSRGNLEKELKKLL